MFKSLFDGCSIDNLRAQKAVCSAEELVWDKDDDLCLDFVTAAANLRAYIFGISLKNRFDVKCEFSCLVQSIYTQQLNPFLLLPSNGWKYNSCYCHHQCSYCWSHGDGGSQGS